MAYHIDQANGDIVIDGFEQGIADAPEQGISFMRNINLITVPGEAAVNFKTSAISAPPTSAVTGVSCTFATTNSIVDFGASTYLYTGLCVTFGSTSGGVTAGTLYWVSNVSGTTGKVYTDIGHSQLVAVTTSSNTYSIVSLGKLTHKALDLVNNYVFMLDSNGRAWWINAIGNLTFIGNVTLTGAQGNGLCVVGDFLYVFRDAAVDYIPITYMTSTSAPAWTYGWQVITAPTPSSNPSHFALATQDNGMYFCNNQFVASVLATSGNNIDPSSATTYTFNASALRLPSVDRATCLAELGTSLLVGGIQNKVYPWDRVSTSYTYPLVLSENLTTRMVTTNSSTYIFAGNRGRIYITNGSNINLFKKIPDHTVQIFSAANGTDPYFTWKDAMYWKNQIYFSFEAAKNDGTVITNMGGIWALDVSMNIMGTATAVGLRMVNTLSGGAATVPSVIAPNIRTATPGGAGIYAGWYNTLSTSYGVDITTTGPYATGDNIGGEIYTDLIPTGTFIAPRTFSQVEFKLAKQMVSGESVRISVRQSNSDSWTLLGTTTTAVLVDKYSMAVQNGQWIQLYVELFSTASSPSFVPLKELRIR